MKKFLFAAVFVTGTFSSLASVAHAQMNPACTWLGAAYTEEQIAQACTSEIQSGKYQGSVLSALLTYRGFAHEKLDRADLAIADYTAAIALEPTAARFDARCSVLALEDKFQEALADCNEALKFNPTSPDALDSRGFVYLKLGRLDEAIVDFNAALNLAPGFTNAMFSRGVAKLRKGDAVGGLADIASAKAIELGIGERFEFYGVVAK